MIKPPPAGVELKRGRRGALWLLAFLVIGAIAVSLGMGAVVIAPSEVLGAIARKLGVQWGAEPSRSATAVIWEIRLPRALLAGLSGASFGVAGAALQGVFRNRLADPHLLGIGPGASLGGVIGATAGGVSGAIAGGTVGGMLTALLLKRLSATRSSEPSRFILTGVALGLAITAWVGFVVFTADRARVPPLEFWLLGNLAGTTWAGLSTTLLLTGVAVIGLLAGARILDVLALGEADAARLGIDVGLTLTMLLMGVGALTGAAVGAGGVIVFVGLIAPHVVRRLVGTTHRILLVGSALMGGLLVTIADLVARTAASPIEIPVGLVTAAIGGPFFLWLIRKPDYPGTT